MYESVDMLHEVFAKEYYVDKRNSNYLRLLEKSRNVEGYKGTKISYANNDYGWFEWGKIHFSISNFSSSNVLFVYERADGFETKGWALIQRFNEYVSNETIHPANFNDITRFIPVMWYSDKPPEDAFDPTLIKSDKYFSHKIHFRIEDQNCFWEDSSGKKIANPLLENDTSVGDI